jgi:hypothetical protein
LSRVPSPGILQPDIAFGGDPPLSSKAVFRQNFLRRVEKLGNAVVKLCPFGSRETRTTMIVMGGGGGASVGEVDESRGGDSGGGRCRDLHVNKSVGDVVDAVVRDGERVRLERVHAASRGREREVLNLLSSCERSNTCLLYERGAKRESRLSTTASPAGSGLNKYSCLTALFLLENIASTRSVPL